MDEKIHGALLGKASLNELIEAVVTHLRDEGTDLDELCDLLGYISGTKIFMSTSEPDTTAAVYDTSEGFYGGMFDNVLVPETMCMCSKCGYCSIEPDFKVLEDGEWLGSLKCPVCGNEAPTVADPTL